MLPLGRYLLLCRQNRWDLLRQLRLCVLLGRLLRLGRLDPLDLCFRFVRFGRLRRFDPCLPLDRFDRFDLFDPCVLFDRCFLCLQWGR